MYHLIRDKLQTYSDNYRTTRTTLIRIGLLLVFGYGVFQLLGKFYWLGALIELIILFFALSIKHDKVILSKMTIDFKSIAWLPLLSDTDTFNLKDIDEVSIDGVATRVIDVIDDALPYEISMHGPSGFNTINLTFKDKSMQSIRVDLNLQVLHRLVSDLRIRLNVT